MRGPKPRPAFLKLVKGTRKSRLNRNEPLPDPNLPMPPPHLSDEAKVEWGRVSEDLYRLGILTKIDRAALAAYCQAYGRWVRAELVLAEMAKRDELSGGLMVRTLNGNAIQNPMVGTANKAMADMVRYATDLGMTPSARSRVQVSPGGNAQDPAAKYLT
jgi:P27 family predicted phage terminase small subunit